jgi:IS5 family transposase
MCISIDAEHKLIREYLATPANVHDSQAFDPVIDVDNADPEVWADSAYRSQEVERALDREEKPLRGGLPLSALQPREPFRIQPGEVQ